MCRKSAALAIAAFLVVAFAQEPAEAAGKETSPGGTVTVTISPASVTLLSLQTCQFTATVKGSTDTEVTWKATWGSVNNGLYTADWVKNTTIGTLTATSKADKSASATATITINPIPPVVINTTSIPNTLTSTQYSQALNASGGTPPYSWSVTIGALPTGLTLSADGTISGSTSETGTFKFWVRASDSSKYQKNANQQLIFTVNLDLSTTTVPSNFFDMHIALSGTPWPSSPIAGRRLWDSGATWGLINTAQGVYNWTNLDTELATAKTHNVDVLYDLGMTPPWAQCNESTPSPCTQTPGCGNSSTYGGGPGQCYWPGDLNLDGTGTDKHWIDWVTAVATHSVNSTTAHITYYEIWNEPNVDEFWRGTTAQLVRMAQDAYCIIKGSGPNCTNTAIDPNALIVAPPPSLGGDQINVALLDYFSLGGAQYTDVIAFHGYNGTNDAKIPALVSTVRDGAQTQYGLLDKPLFDDEFSWGAGVYFPDPDEQAGFTARSVLLHWSSGVSRLYWYAWDVAASMWSISDVTGCTIPDPSGDGYDCEDAIAWSVVQQWIVGKTLSQPCMAIGTVWTCSFSSSKGFRGLAVWDSSQSCGNGVCTTTTYTIPPGSPNYTEYIDLMGNKYSISGDTVQIGYKPIYLVNR